MLTKKKGGAKTNRIKLLEVKGCSESAASIDGKSPRAKACLFQSGKNLNKPPITCNAAT